MKSEPQLQTESVEQTANLVEECVNAIEGDLAIQEIRKLLRQQHSKLFRQDGEHLSKLLQYRRFRSAQ